mmetsp:Transcript_61811/g.93367  ORF Transcript_61811/g.93367 Transcript_61811/m.93367 type:complete len:274 (+) Transcript_61811:427-1248(+)
MVREGNNPGGLRPIHLGQIRLHERPLLASRRSIVFRTPRYNVHWAKVERIVKALEGARADNRHAGPIQVRCKVEFPLMISGAEHMQRRGRHGLHLVPELVVDGRVRLRVIVGIGGVAEVEDQVVAKLARVFPHALLRVRRVAPHEVLSGVCSAHVTKDTQCECFCAHWGRRSREAVRIGPHILVRRAAAVENARSGRQVGHNGVINCSIKPSCAVRVDLCVFGRGCQGLRRISILTLGVFGCGAKADVRRDPHDRHLPCTGGQRELDLLRLLG